MWREHEPAWEATLRCSASSSVTAGPVQISGVRLRVLTKDYVWRNPTDGRETIPSVLHVEAERVDTDSPARLVYRLGNEREITFELRERLGVFVYSDVRSRGGVLVESHGWKQVPP